MTRVAAIDCGTNSIRLLIAEPGERGLVDRVRQMRVVRLGQGVDETGEFNPQALQRTLQATADYARLCREHEVQAVRFVATSATRDARNREQFLYGVRELLGVVPEVISGQEEASLSLTGALSVLGPESRPPALVVDLGGGSTELVRANADSQQAFSMDVGCVRLSERFLHSDPPTSAEVSQVQEAMRQWLDLAAQAVDFNGLQTVVGVAGTVTTVTAHALNLQRYDPEIINGTRLPLARTLAACEDLIAMPRAQREQLPYLHPGRVDVIAAGALVWSQVLRRLSAANPQLRETVTSEHDILDGIAYSVLARLGAGNHSPS